MRSLNTHTPCTWLWQRLCWGTYQSLLCDVSLSLASQNKKKLYNYTSTLVYYTYIHLYIMHNPMEFVYACILYPGAHLYNVQSNMEWSGLPGWYVHVANLGYSCSLPSVEWRSRGVCTNFCWHTQLSQRTCTCECACVPNRLTLQRKPCVKLWKLCSISITLAGRGMLISWQELGLCIELVATFICALNHIMTHTETFQVTLQY